MNREQAFLLVIVAITALASMLILLPFLNFVLAALLLGYMLRPLHRRLTPYAGRKPAAAVTIVGALALLLVPLGFIGWVLYRDARAIAEGEADLNLEAVQPRIEELLGRPVPIGATTEDLGNLMVDVLFGNLGQVLGFATTLALGLALLLFLVYYVLLDGPAFVQWAVDTAPVDDAVAHYLVVKMDRMTWGVVVGHIFVAFVQGIIGGIGLWIAGVPSPVFWAAVMVFTALLPIIGAFLVWGPAAIYLYLIEEPTMALFLAVWGLVIVSLVDNYLRSIVIDQSAEVNPGVILVGVVGGIYTLGSVGLFVGPIVIGLFAATIRAFDDYYDALAHDTPPPTPPDDGRLSWLVTDPAALSAESASAQAGGDDAATGADDLLDHPGSDPSMDPVEGSETSPEGDADDGSADAPGGPGDADAADDGRDDGADGRDEDAT